MLCPKCGKENPIGASFCSHCGSPLDVDTTISFESLNRGNHAPSPLDQLRSEANRANTFAILSLVFSCLGGLLGLIFAIININRISAVNRMNFFPDDVSELDAYEAYKRKLHRARKMTVIALIVFAAVTVITVVLTYILAYYGIDIYGMLLDGLYK